MREDPDCPALFDESRFGVVARIRRRHLARHTGFRGRGLEIGPYAHPTVRRDEADIRYLDVETRANLIANLPAHLDPTHIPEIDYVPKTTKYYDEIEEKFDFIIANHVIEHVPDMIAWLQGINHLLQDDGVLFLAIPDKTFTFDRHRPTTTLSHHLAIFFDGVDKASAETMLEVDLLYDAGPGSSAIDIAARLDVSRLRKVFLSDPHFGVHSHVFDSGSLLPKIFEPLMYMALIDFTVLDFVPARAAAGGEILLILRKGAIEPRQLPARFFDPPAESTIPIGSGLARWWSTVRSPVPWVLGPGKMMIAQMPHEAPLSEYVTNVIDRSGVYTALSLGGPGSGADIPAIWPIELPIVAALEALQTLIEGARPARLILLVEGDSLCQETRLGAVELFIGQYEFEREMIPFGPEDENWGTRVLIAAWKDARPLAPL